MLQLLNYFLFLQLKCVLKEQFVSTEKVTAKAMKALTEVLKNGFLECFQTLYEHWQSVSLLKGTTLKEMAFGMLYPSTCGTR
jgi:hypothetical protein